MVKKGVPNGMLERRRLNLKRLCKGWKSFQIRAMNYDIISLDDV